MLVTATSLVASYDIIFMDIQMPEMDGVAATAEIRRQMGSATARPVVAMTAYSMQEDAGRFMSQGLDDYVGKPVKSRHLYEVLHRWLRPRKARPATPFDDLIDQTPEAATPVAPVAAAPWPCPNTEPYAGQRCRSLRQAFCVN